MTRCLALTLLLAACGNAPVDGTQAPASDQTSEIGRSHVVKGIDLRRQCDHTLSYSDDYPSFTAGDGPSVSLDLCAPSAALHQIKGWFIAGGESYCFTYPSQSAPAPINPTQYRRCTESFEFRLPSAGPTRFYFRGVDAIGDVVASGGAIVERAADGNDFRVPLEP
jgi:hypothetical protein